MSDSRALLDRISQFRQRLENRPLLSATDPHAIADRSEALAANGTLLTAALRELAGPAATAGPTPVQLTARARRVLEEAKVLVEAQKRLAENPTLAHLAGDDPLARYHRGTVTLTEGALRLVQAFPASADVQIRMCDGVEAMLRAVRDRMKVGEQALSVRAADQTRIDKLARMLSGLCEGISVPLAAFAELAEQVLADARRGTPIRFLTVDPMSAGSATEKLAAPPPARFVAAASLTLAQVVARVAVHDYEWATRPLLPVVAALLADVGMVKVPAAVLAKPSALTADERRLVERHPLVGAEIVRKLLPEARPLAEAIESHHEMLDGTGYPEGSRGEQIPTLGRLLATCAVYAGMATDRPHRPAVDPRTALTDCLVAAEHGRLDRDFTEYLLNLSFHPVGTVVELTDGRVAVVVANHTSRLNLRATARPVVAILTDDHFGLLPRPDFVDLAAAERGGVVRALPTHEKRRLLAEHYPDLC